VTCTSRLALVHAFRGELVCAARTARAALDLPPCAGQPPSVHCGPAYLAAAIVDIHRDRLAAAEPNLEVAGRLCDATLDPALAAVVTTVRAQLRHYQGDMDAAYATLLAARRQLNGRSVPRHLQRWLAVAEADVRITHGDTATVREMLEPLMREPRQPPPEVSVAIARAHARDNDMGSVVRTLPAWEDGEATAMPLAVRLEAGLLDALAAHQLADRRRCTTALEHVLALAEPEGFRRVFTSAGTAVRDLLVRHLDCGTAYWSLVNDLVAASRDAGSRPATPTMNLDEPLTERELTVLRFLQSVLSLTEIAAELHLSVNTVKTHLRNIYRKLDTNRRREAVRRGRDMRLI
jgi:LuxR family maltose regulon positive regulatory protein